MKAEKTREKKVTHRPIAARKKVSESKLDWPKTRRTTEKNAHEPKRKNRMKILHHKNRIISSKTSRKKT